jgi:hypothetical protein
MGALVKRKFEFDRIVALSPITNAVLQNCIDLAQSQGDHRDVQILNNQGTVSLMKSLERMDIQIFVDHPLIFINDLYKIDSLRENFNEQMFCQNLQWISNRLATKQVANSEFSSTTWVYDYPERHLSEYLGTDLPLDRQQRSREITHLAHYCCGIQGIQLETLECVISVLIKYGLDTGWKHIATELLHKVEPYFTNLRHWFPQHDEFRQKAIQINELNDPTANELNEKDVLVDGALQLMKVLSMTSNGNTQVFASYYKNMLGLTLETSTRLLDAAASARAFEARMAKEFEDLNQLKMLVAKRTEEIRIKNLLIQELIRKSN